MTANRNLHINQAMNRTLSAKSRELVRAREHTDSFMRQHVGGASEMGEDVTPMLNSPQSNNFGNLIARSSLTWVDLMRLMSGLSK